LLNTQSIVDAKHIVISLPSQASIEAVAAANALYSYVLTLHKKVSLHSDEISFSKNLTFLPWMQKIKSSYPTSADLEISVDKSENIVGFFKTNNIKLNKKMATSLYAALVAKTESFSKSVDGMVFAWAKELVEAGADAVGCNKYILSYNSLATLRLKAIMLKKLMLTEEANVAFINLTDEDLRSSGTTISDAKIIVKDALSLPTVNRVIVKYNNQEIINEGEEV
jgi:hypothetical protein